MIPTNADYLFWSMKKAPRWAKPKPVSIHRVINSHCPEIAKRDRVTMQTENDVSLLRLMRHNRAKRPNNHPQLWISIAETAVNPQTIMRPERRKGNFRKWFRRILRNDPALVYTLPLAIRVLMGTGSL